MQPLHLLSLKFHQVHAGHGHLSAGGGYPYIFGQSLTGVTVLSGFIGNTKTMTSGNEHCFPDASLERRNQSLSADFSRTSDK